MVMPRYAPGNEFRFTSGYSEARPSPFDPNVTRPHRGEDWAAPAGTLVPAATSGVVQFSGVTGFGNTVVIRHIDASGNSYYTVYAHLESPGIEVGAVVVAGSGVGLVGNSGLPQNSGSHLHFEVVTRGNDVPLGENPLIFQVGRVDPATVDFPRTPWTTTVQLAPADNGAPLPPPSRLGGPTDFAEAATKSGWATTVEYPDGTTGPGLKSGDTVTYSDGTTGTFTIAGASTNGQQAWGTLEVRDAIGNNAFTIVVSLDGSL